MSTAASADCCCPRHCPSLIATRRPWPQRLREALALAAGRLLAASRNEPGTIQMLDARALRDIGWCCEALPDHDAPALAARRLPELW